MHRSSLRCGGRAACRALAVYNRGLRMSTGVINDRVKSSGQLETSGENAGAKYPRLEGAPGGIQLPSWYGCGDGVRRPRARAPRAANVWREARDCGGHPLWFYSHDRRVSILRSRAALAMRNFASVRLRDDVLNDVLASWRFYSGFYFPRF